MSILKIALMLSTVAPIQTIVLPRGVRVFDLQFLPPDDGFALAADDDSSLRIFELATGRLTRTIRVHDEHVFVSDVALTPNGRHALVGISDGPAELVNLETGDVERTYRDGDFCCQRAALTPDGRLAVIGGKDGATLWDVANGQALVRYDLPGQYVRSLAVAGEGRFVVIGGNRDGNARIFDLTSGELLRTMQASGRQITTFAISPDQRYLLAPGWAEVYLWEVATGRLLRRFSAGRYEFNAVSFAPGLDLVLAAGEDGFIIAWDLATGEERYRLSGHSDAIVALATSADGARVMSASVDRTIRVWSTTPRPQRSVP